MRPADDASAATNELQWHWGEAYQITGAGGSQQTTASAPATSAAVCLHPLPDGAVSGNGHRPAAHGVTVTGSAAAREQRPSPAADGAKPPRVRDGDRRLADGGDPRLLQDARAIYQTNSRASIQTRCQLSAHEGASSRPRIARACRVRRLRRRTRSGPGCGLDPGVEGAMPGGEVQQAGERVAVVPC
jgi:hypothetical protein